MPRPSKADQFRDPTGMVCDDRVVHLTAVHAARAALPSREELSRLAGVFSALGDPTRLRIVAALAAQELCVCDLAAAVGQSESAVSHQLRRLSALLLVRSRREGRRVFYALDDDHVLTMFVQARDHLDHSPSAVGRGRSVSPANGSR